MVTAFSLETDFIYTIIGKCRFKDIVISIKIPYQFFIFADFCIRSFLAIFVFCWRLRRLCLVMEYRSSKNIHTIYLFTRLLCHYFLLLRTMIICRLVNFKRSNLLLKKWKRKKTCKSHDRCKLHLKDKLVLYTSYFIRCGGHIKMIMICVSEPPLIYYLYCSIF